MADTISVKNTWTAGLLSAGLVMTALLASPLPASAAAQGNNPKLAPGTAEMMAAMEGMKPATDMMTMTGDVDRDFMVMMIIHHDAGIAMSSAEDGFGKRKDLKNMAVLDISDQQKDNREMREALQHPAAAATAAPAAAGNEIMAAMRTMNQSMGGMKLNGDPDHDFIMMMIPHHEAAIAMSQAELKYGSDKRAKKVAQGVIEGQTKDIKDMRTWHKAWYGADYPMK